MKRWLLLSCLLALAACSTPRPGGYFEDDGPPPGTTPDLASIPNAVPRDEPLSPTGNSPYTVDGKTYYPLRSAAGYDERGIASWYGRKFNGKLTSSGERYDMYAMTAASRTLPIPCFVRVRNLENERSVIVKVNDRGPFLHNRLIDLSYAAAAKLGIVATGTGLVEVTAIDPDHPQPPPAAAGAAPGTPPRMFLQLGAFLDRSNAMRLRDRLLRADFGPVFIQSRLTARGEIYRVRVGPLATVDQSDRLIQRAAEFGVPGARVVVE